MINIFFVTLVAWFVAQGSGCTYQGADPPILKQRPPASRERLEERTGAYYNALERHEFKRIWDSYLSIHAKEAERNERAFAVGMYAFFAEVKVVKEPTVIETGISQKDKLRFGKVRASIDVTMGDGDKFKVVHTTLWVWDDAAKQGRLVGDPGDWWLSDQNEMSAVAIASTGQSRIPEPRVSSFEPGDSWLSF